MTDQVANFVRIAGVILCHAIGAVFVRPLVRNASSSPRIVGFSFSRPGYTYSSHSLCRCLLPPSPSAQTTYDSNSPLS